MVRTLNDIPENLRDDRWSRNNWTPGRGLLRGTLWTGLAAAAAAGVMFSVGSFAPPLGNSMLVNAMVVFALTCLLFTVMHHTAGMAGPPCSAVVVVAVLAVLLAKQCGVAWATESWTSMSPAAVVLGNLPAIVAMAGAAWMCKDGDSIAHTLADLAMTNPFTGRRG